MHCTWPCDRNLPPCTFRHSNRIQPPVSCVGFPLRRRTMANWTVQTSTSLFLPLNLSAWTREPVLAWRTCSFQRASSSSGFVSSGESRSAVDRRSFRSSIGPCHVVSNVWSTGIPRGATWRLRRPTDPHWKTPKPRPLSEPYPFPRRGPEDGIAFLAGTWSSGTILAAPFSRRGSAQSTAPMPLRVMS